MFFTEKGLSQTIFLNPLYQQEVYKKSKANSMFHSRPALFQEKQAKSKKSFLLPLSF